MIVIRDIIAHKKGIVKGKESLIVPLDTRVLACGENSHALRLENVSLREPLSDLRAGNANLIFAHNVRKKLGENLPVPQPTQKGHQADWRH